MKYNKLSVRSCNFHFSPIFSYILYFISYFSYPTSLNTLHITYPFWSYSTFLSTKTIKLLLYYFTSSQPISFLFTGAKTSIWFRIWCFLKNIELDCAQDLSSNASHVMRKPQFTQKSPLHLEVLKKRTCEYNQKETQNRKRNSKCQQRGSGWCNKWWNDSRPDSRTFLYDWNKYSVSKTLYEIWERNLRRIRKSSLWLSYRKWENRAKDGTESRWENSPKWSCRDMCYSWWKLAYTKLWE